MRPIQPRAWPRHHGDQWRVKSPTAPRLPDPWCRPHVARRGRPRGLHRLQPADTIVRHRQGSEGRRGTAWARASTGDGTTTRGYPQYRRPVIGRAASGPDRDRRLNSPPPSLHPAWRALMVFTRRRSSTPHRRRHLERYVTITRSTSIVSLPLTGCAPAACHAASATA